MARAHFVKAARKARPEAGIAVGDSYWHWSFRYGGKHYSKTPPRRSRLTSSDKLSRSYAAAEALEDLAAGIGEETTIDDIRSELETIASDLEEIAQEYRDSKDNMPESLQDGEVGQQCEDNADNLESWAHEIHQLADNWDEDDFDPEAARSDIQEQAGACPL